MYLYSALMFYKPKQHTKDVVFILYGTCCKQNIIQDNGIVVCLSTPWGINNKSEVDIHLAVINDKRSSKSATSLSHSHSLTNWYTGYMHDDQ